MQTRRRGVLTHQVEKVLDALDSAVGSIQRAYSKYQKRPRNAPQTPFFTRRAHAHAQAQAHAHDSAHVGAHAQVPHAATPQRQQMVLKHISVTSECSDSSHETCSCHDSCNDWHSCGGDDEEYQFSGTETVKQNDDSAEEGVKDLKVSVRRVSFIPEAFIMTTYSKSEYDRKAETRWRAPAEWDEIDRELAAMRGEMTSLAAQQQLQSISPCV